MDQQTYDNGYEAALPVQLKALMALPTVAQRAAQAVTLANQGFIIWGEVMVFGWDPFVAAQLRSSQGYTWVPSFLQPPLESVPGVPPLAGFQPYDPNNPPAGSVLIYWPNPPAPVIVVPPPSSNPTFTLGPSMAPDFPNDYEMNGDGPSIPVGQVVTIGSVSYVKQLLGHSPFAPNGIITGWSQQSA